MINLKITLTAYQATWLQHLAVTAHGARCHSAAARSGTTPAASVGTAGTRGGATRLQGTEGCQPRRPRLRQTMKGIQVLETKCAKMSVVGAVTEIFFVSF